MQTQPLAGKTAFITGGSGAIGSATARVLAADGAAVLIMSRRAEALAEVKAAIERDIPGARIDYHAGDATKVEDVRAGLEKAHALQGRLDIIVPLVGGGPFKPFLMLDVETVRETLDFCITSAFIAMRYGAPLMTEGGSIVCISSNVGKMPFRYLSAYHAGKSGLEGLVRAAAEELGSAGIRVNAVRPGLTRTEAAGMMFTEKSFLDRYTEQTPLGKCGGEPEDIARAVRFLAGPDSSWITGQSFAVDGGHELRRNPDMTDLVTQMFGQEAMDAVYKGQSPA
ncbi:SDR family NAD(P)-dependent oxidoreductase [Flavisphingomonas formosensis]|uniref:SDR family NAD(P)-dependent oxidoreductase n=1 Tax=Flavisphingomonas formosensis TaxID=861534 RepID=UPI0012FC85A7|nr:SDR family NAD(P)-dependent oxidoreductase [Sphingomonas formosensis]